MPALSVDKFHPGLSVDCVILGFHQNELKALLLKMKKMDKWALPGGFVEKEEDVDKAAVRVLWERTGLKDIFLQQFYLFGDVGREEEGHVEGLVQKGVIDRELAGWLKQRFVTVGYYALVEYSQVEAPQPDYLSESCEWRSLSALPELMLDHGRILEKAHATLKRQLNYQPIGLNLLPRRFTMPELQALYETLLGQKLDRRNFQRKMMGYGILIRTGERRTGGAHKSPWLYEFDEEKYRQSLAGGLNAGW
ncbi:MAG: NUDIX hydrolase [Phaeodactylibacter sp.]|nr:NUDIX hydrolase [Phaeodactylibacter sp.]